MNFLRAYCLSAVCSLSETLSLEQCGHMRRLRFALSFFLGILYPCPPVPPRAGTERMKELRKEKTTLITDVKAALQPLPMWPDSHPIISESPAPSILPGWNRSSKTHIRFNESMNDSSNQFNLAYAFLIGVPINYQLPVFTFQCLTIFCWLL